MPKLSMGTGSRVLMCHGRPPLCRGPHDSPNDNLELKLRPVVPALLEHSRRILAIPAKKTDIRLVHYLTVEEMQSLLNVPDLHRRDGIRDRAMLHLCFAAGLRVSELVRLPLKALEFYPMPSVRILGKGRKE